MKHARSIMLGAALLLAPEFAAAQSGPFAQPLPDQFVQGIMQITRQNITRARLDDGSNVPAETEAERAQPLLPLEDGRRVVETGRVSAFARWCNIEWQERSFIRLMRAERAKRIWSPKQIAYIGMLHGVTMGVMGGELEKRGACPEATRPSVEAHIARQIRR